MRVFVNFIAVCFFSRFSFFVFFCSIPVCSTLCVCLWMLYSCNRFNSCLSGRKVPQRYIHNQMYNVFTQTLWNRIHTKSERERENEWLRENGWNGAEYLTSFKYWRTKYQPNSKWTEPNWTAKAQIRTRNVSINRGIVTVNVDAVCMLLSFSLSLSLDSMFSRLERFAVCFCLLSHVYV